MFRTLMSLIPTLALADGNGTGHGFACDMRAMTKDELGL